MTLAVYWQVHDFDFVSYDDPFYITGNSHVQSGVTLNGFFWTFSTKYFGLWNPLVWLSFMFDYQFYGLNAGGYHLTNLILHILSTLLLFWIFCRMTGEIWKSAFIASFFALHPLHIESVAWISERKDVLGAFLWMLTLRLYVYYTERPVLKRYLLVVIAFVLALLSKPMVITLPLILILMDFWPLKRFESRESNVLMWQVKEKLPLLILSLVLVFITFYTPGSNVSYKFLPLQDRLANAPVAFVTYLIKTFWPLNLAVFYPFPKQIPIWPVMGAFLLIVFISAAVIILFKKTPQLFTGWLWYTITIAPVIGIIQIGDFAVADRYHYLPSVGISMMLAWGIPSLIRNDNMRRKILFPAAVAFLLFLSALAWKQCGYWRNSFSLFSRAVEVTQNNYLAYTSLGLAWFEKGNITEAIEHYNKAILIKPDYDEAYNNRGIAYVNLGQYQSAIEDYSSAIRIHPAFANYHYNRGYTYEILGQYPLAIEDYTMAIRLQPTSAKFYYIRGCSYGKIGQYQSAFEDCNEAIRFNPDYAEAYMCRGSAYLKQGNKDLGCRDAQTACLLGACILLEVGKRQGICR
jgi:tetratricopeptide (TPR) repeat protein